MGQASRPVSPYHDRPYSAAVHLQRRAGNIARRVAQQERRGAREFFRLSVASQRDGAGRSLALLLQRDAGALRVGVVQIGQALRRDPARHQLVDTNLLRGQLVGQRLDQRGHRGADDIRQPQIRNRILDRRRSQHQNAAPAARLHGGQHHPNRADRAHHQQLEGVAPRRVIEAGGRTRRRTARVRHQHVHAAEALHGGAMPGLDRLGGSPHRLPTTSPAHRSVPQSAQPAALIVSALRAAIETCAPSAASAWAMANPSPWLAAATIATFPLIPRSIPSVYRHCRGTLPFGAAVRARHSVMTAAPSMESLFRASSASFACSSGNAVTLGRRSISAAI